MSQEFVMRVLFSGIFGLVFAWGVFSRYDTEVGSESVNGERQKYLPYIPSSLLPEFVLVIGVMAAYYLGIVGAVRLTLGVCFSIFLHISVYYIVLIP